MSRTQKHRTLHTRVKGATLGHEWRRPSPGLGSRELAALGVLLVVGRGVERSLNSARAEVLAQLIVRPAGRWGSQTSRAPERARARPSH